MNADTRARYAIRCIVVTTLAGMASVGRAAEYDSITRERLQADILERGKALLDQFERAEDHIPPHIAGLMRTARADLGS